MTIPERAPQYSVLRAPHIAAEAVLFPVAGPWRETVPGRSRGPLENDKDG